jgi:hypothetical protein
VGGSCWLLEDAVDDGGLFGVAGAEVAGGGFDGGLAEERLDLCGVGAALAEAGGVGVAEPVGA